MLRTEKEARPALEGGIVAGLVGGIFLALLLLAMALLAHQSPWAMLKGAGTPFLHERAMSPEFDLTAVAVGVLCHFAISIGWGVLFGALAFGLTRSATLLFGVFWGVVVWLGMYYLLLPAVGMGAMARSEPIGMAVGLHVGFGVALALGFMPFQQYRPRQLRPA